MAERSDQLLTNGGGVNSRLDYGGGSGISPAGVIAPPLVGSNAPTQRFDISVLDRLKPSDKYLGKNRVSDIREAYDTYLSGVEVGRGGRYAADAARRYGTTLTEAARGYLATVGLPTLADVAPASTLPKELEEKEFFELPVGPSPASPQQKSPVELLLDAIPRLFGNVTASAPLQSQAYGYTPVSGDFDGASSGGGIGMWLLLAGAALAAYLIYKRYG